MSKRSADNEEAKGASAAKKPRIKSPAFMAFERNIGPLIQSALGINKAIGALKETITALELDHLAATQAISRKKLASESLRAAATSNPAQNGSFIAPSIATLLNGSIIPLLGISEREEAKLPFLLREIKQNQTTLAECLKEKDKIESSVEKLIRTYCQTNDIDPLLIWQYFRECTSTPNFCDVPIVPTPLPQDHDARPAGAELGMNGASAARPQSPSEVLAMGSADPILELLAMRSSLLDPHSP